MAKAKRYVKYDANRGIVSERVISDQDWKDIGVEFGTLVFNKQNMFMLEATDWPIPVMEYFTNVDKNFVVLSEDEASAAQASGQRVDSPNSIVTDEASEPEKAPEHLDEPSKVSDSELNADNAG